MIFCDMSKAFDRVWHRGLLLNNIELHDPFLNGFLTISVIEHNESPLNPVFPVLGLLMLSAPGLRPWATSLSYLC